MIHFGPLALFACPTAMLAAYFSLAATFQWGKTINAIYRSPTVAIYAGAHFFLFLAYGVHCMSMAYNFKGKMSDLSSIYVIRREIQSAPNEPT